MPPKTTQQSSAVLDLALSKRVLICCGSGGVGKTTTAAALALQVAAQGKKVLVLTIDPAKRLADSLGIAKIDYQERKISATQLKKAGLSLAGSLYAMMMDTKQTFDDLIQRHATSSQQAQAILENPLYQHLSNMIAGSQEYMAMEKLYEMVSERDYDLIVLDTPPSRHALDFLDAPQKMQKMIGDSVMKVFLKPSLFVSRAGFKLLDRTMQKIMGSFDQIAGFEFLHDLSVMLVSLAELLEGFEERAKKVQALLHDPKTTFLLIAAPQPIPLREAEYFYHKVRELELPFAGFIFNRVQNSLDSPLNFSSDLNPEVRQSLKKIHNLFKLLAQRDHRELASFQKKLKNEDSFLFQTVPQLDHDVHDLNALQQLGEKLVE